MYIPKTPEQLKLPATLSNGTSVTVERTIDRYRLERVSVERLATAASPDAMQLRVSWSKGYTENGAYVLVHGTEIRVEGEALEQLFSELVPDSAVTLYSAVSETLWRYLAECSAIPPGDYKPGPP